MSERPVTLLTGASSGIGGALLASLAREPGVILAHFNRRQPVLPPTETKAEIVPLAADFEARESLDGMIDAIGMRYSYPDRIVLLPARKMRMERFNQFDATEFNRDMEVQVGATLRLLRAFLPRMAQARCKGRVVFVLSSVTLGMPPRNLASYTVAKYALLGLMRSLAAEYAGNELCLNAVSPSMTETEFLTGVPAKLVEVTAAQHPLKRNARPTDIVPAIRFLLSDECEYMTGVNLPVTGGLIG